MDEYERKAREESRDQGYEYRPGARDSSREAERLQRGFEMLASAGDTDEDDE